MFALCSYISSLAKKENAAREAAELAAKVDRKEWDDSSIGEGDVELHTSAGERVAGIVVDRRLQAA